MEEVQLEIEKTNMKYPVILNTFIIDEDGKKNIVAGVVDMHPDGIEEILNGATEGTTIILKTTGRAITVIAPFMDVVHIYMNNKSIMGQYLGEVEEYLRENWLPYRTKRDGEKD